MSSPRHTLLMVIMLTIMSVIIAACGSVRTVDGSGMPSSDRLSKRAAKSTDSGQRVKNKIPRRHEVDRKKHTRSKSSSEATDDEWKTLDFKLDDDDNHELYREIKSWLGTPHIGGAHTKQKGTDCSGFVMEIYLTVYDMKLERNSARIFSRNCKRIDPDELQEGDLVFFHTGSSNDINHVGIYLKDNKFAHASSSRGVVIDDLSSKYYIKHFSAAGRVIK